MKRTVPLKHEFVEYMPNDLKDDTIYISIRFNTIVHKCCCGCGSKVVTPLSPTDWQLIFDGKSISLYPSIGNWSLPCKSHYWIRQNRVQWASRWSQKRINEGRAHDVLTKEKYFESINTPIAHDTIVGVKGTEKVKAKESIWRKLKKQLF